MHACLLGGRCLGRRCKVLLKHPGYTLRRLCLPEWKKKKKKNYISVMYCALFPTFQLSFCLAHLLNFIYLLMWHFCYTVLPALGDPRRERPPAVYGHFVNVPTHFNVKLPLISGHLPNADADSHILVVSTCYNGQCK